MSAADRGWGPGWPYCQSSNIVTISRSDGLRLPVHRGIAELVSILMELTEAQGYDIVNGWTWGYACRAISGSSSPSNHSWGLAVDINAPKNPMGSTLITDMPAGMVSLWKNHGFGWGGDYSTRKDAMHFEFLGTPADAARYTSNLKSFLQNAGFDAPRTLKKGDKGKVVTWLRGLLGMSVTGKYAANFGWAVERKVKEFQKKHGLKADGVVGPATWRALSNK